MKLSRQFLLGVIVFMLGTAVVAVTRDEGASPLHLGPEPGSEVEQYIAARAEVLARARDVRAAVVSFHQYLGEGLAAEALGDVRAARWLVCAPTSTPETVVDVEQWAQARASLHGLETSGPVIFAAVVIAPAESLRSIAAHPSVRLVDLVAEPVSVRGLRPEENAVAGQPATRP